MTKRIFKTIFIVAISMFIASVVVFMTVLYDYFSGVQQSQLRTQTELTSQGVINEGVKYFNGLKIKDYRVTWIGTDGNVIYDSVSNTDKMENHFEREEVKEALSTGYGESTRYSSTLTKRYLYSAKRLPNGTVVRLSVTQSSLLFLTLGMLQPICIIFIIAIVLSIILASRLSKNIVKPLNDLNLDKPLSNDGYEEISPLLKRINTQQCQIKKQRDELIQKQSEFETVTSCMTEGIVLLNNKGIILSLNHAAAVFLESDNLTVGSNILSFSQTFEFSDVIYKAELKSYAEKIISIENKKYRISANPVISNGDIPGIVLLILDVTEKEKTEQIRREFSANVSHELKTPLHTISGCAELLANGMVKNEKVTDFSKQIYAQAQRMILLIEDIIKLSHLDEGADDMIRENTDLYKLAENEIKTLTDEAKSADVQLNFNGETSVLYSIPQLISVIIHNLCDNAIKYNHKGGSVSVTVKDEGEFAVLSVSDTGIGIPKEHLERIFERFYRVDKSHSKEIGGTGLGLSIVKHAARLLDAKIELHSIVLKGTDITVSFPKNK